MTHRKQNKMVIKSFAALTFRRYAAKVLPPFCYNCHWFCYPL